MKIEIDCNTLKNELSKLKETVSARNTMPMLANALIEANEEDQTLILKATDLDISISTSCPCKVIEPGGVTIPAMTLHKIASTTRTETITIEVEENHWAKLVAGSFSCRVAGTHPSDFPTVASVEDYEFFKADAGLILDMINKSSFCISTDEGRPNLTGVFFKYSAEKTLTMVATDGHRLAIVESQPEEFVPHTKLPNDILKGVIIPAKGIKQLARTLEPEAYELEFGVKKGKIAFRHGPTTIIMRLIDGTYPNYRQILPKPAEKPAYVDREALVYALKFVQLFTNSKTNRVRFTLTKDNLNVYANDPETGEGSQDIAVEYEGDEAVVGYNIKYFMDVLNVIEGDQVALSIIDALSPTQVEDPDRDRLLFIVMPMRV